MAKAYNKEPMAQENSSPYFDRATDPFWRLVTLDWSDRVNHASQDDKKACALIKRNEPPQWSMDAA